MPPDPDDGQLDELMCDALLELYRLRCHMRLAAFKEELRRDSATVRRALDEVFWKMDREIDRREGGRP
jgi:hypothetical protein